MSFSLTIYHSLRTMNMPQLSVKNVNFLPQETLVTLYYSLVESRLRYCNTVWGNCGNLLKRKLQTLQNRAAWVITRTTYGSVDPETLLTNFK